MAPCDHGIFMSPLMSPTFAPYGHLMPHFSEYRTQSVFTGIDVRIVYAVCAQVGAAFHCQVLVTVVQ